MISKGYIIKNEIKEEINIIEEEYDVHLSTIQKILLSTAGPISSILDVLYGTVRLFMLDQHFEKANKDTAGIIEIEEGDDMLYREAIVHKRGRPLVHVTSCIPSERCTDEILEDLLNEKLTTGKIIEKNNQEIMIKTTKISIEKPTSILIDLFKTDEDLLTREYAIINKGKVVIWTKESYPLSYFTIN